MAKKNQSSVFEDITHLISYLPWWAGVIIAVTSYLWLHNVVSQPIEMLTPNGHLKIGDMVAKQMWHSIAFYMQYIIPLCSLIGAAISAYKKYAKNKVSETLEISKTDHQKREVKTTTNQKQSTPYCPQCGASMIKRTAKKGNNVGESFWGCENFPKCKGTRAV